MAIKDLLKKKKVVQDDKGMHLEGEKKLPDVASPKSADPVELNKIALKQNSFTQNNECRRDPCACIGLKENLRQFCLHRNKRQ